MKLDCNVADDTSAIKFTLLDKNIALVQEGQVYQIVNARVRSFQGEKYLSANFDTIITAVKSDVRNMTFVTNRVCMLFPVKLFIEYNPEIIKLHHSLYVFSLDLQCKV